MSWFLFGISTVALFTSMDLLQRKWSLKVKFPRAMAVVFNFCGAILAGIMFIMVGGYKNFNLPQDLGTWAILIFAMLMYAIFERYRFLVAKLVEASVFAIISNIGLAVAFIGSIFIYSETLTLPKIAGTFLIILSLILISLGGRIKNVSVKGVLIGSAIYVVLGLAWMLDKWGAMKFNPNTYNLLGWFVPLIFIYLPYVKTSEIAYEAKRLSWKIVFLPLLNVFGYYFNLRALATGQAIVVIPLVQTFMLATVILGIVLLGERDHIWRKIIAAVIGFSGVLLLVAF